MSSAHDAPAGAAGAEPLTGAVPAPRRSAAEEARTLAAATQAAALATASEDGTPWASLVTFALLDDGTPVLCLSTLAEHGRNLHRDARCSLLVAPEAARDPLATGRVTLAGRARATADDAVRERYLADVAAASSYVGFGDFTLFTLQVERVRWVGGYGRMASAGADDYAAAEPDPVAPAAAGAVAHLNEDHADALLDIVRALAGFPDATAATCTAIDRYGMDLAITTPRGDAWPRVGFAARCERPDGLRAATVELARRARAATS